MRTIVKHCVNGYFIKTASKSIYVRDAENQYETEGVIVINLKTNCDYSYNRTRRGNYWMEKVVNATDNARAQYFEAVGIMDDFGNLIAKKGWTRSK